MTNRETAGANVSGEAPDRMSLTEVSHEERLQLIAEAAYFRAERRSFAPGYELEDWLGAEAEIETRLSHIRAGGSQKLV